MNRDRATNRLCTGCLILSAVLVLGIIQWSFLPILIQNGPVTGKAVLVMSAGHTSKFAAPFKCLFGDSLKPSLVQSRISAPITTQTFFHRPEAPVSSRDDVFFSDRQLRAPPTA